MEDIRSVLSSYGSKPTKASKRPHPEPMEKQATTSEIPDLFFDDILIKYKLTRVEILILMYLYRLTWCRPNLHKKYGIAPMVSHKDVAENLEISIEVLLQNLRRLESFQFIETIRSGQYFVRKYFTRENDELYGQTYDNFI